ncbi:MAG: hypothetical protein WC830_10110 [Burkholderiales bacterium]|jgi:hypothetical protein
MADSNHNPFFLDAEKPFTALAHILIDLEKTGALSVEMRQAICDHAEGLLDTVPNSITGIASVTASAHAGGSGVLDDSAANASWAVCQLADAMHAAKELEYVFSGRMKSEYAAAGVNHG